MRRDLLKRKNTDTREKIQQGWKEKGAPFRSGGAKRQVQGVSKGKKVLAQKDGYKVVTLVVLRRNGGVFSVKKLSHCAKFASKLSLLGFF